MQKLIISVALLLITCSSSKESVVKVWTFEEAKAKNVSQIESLDQNPIENHEWVTSEDCIPEKSTFSMPEDGMRHIFRKIDYPAELRRERIQGDVKARILVDETGKVEGLNFISNTDRRLNNEVRKVIRRANFIPAFCNEKAVSSKQTMTVNFRIHGR